MIRVIKLDLTRDMVKVIKPMAQLSRIYTYKNVFVFVLILFVLLFSQNGFSVFLRLGYYDLNCVAIILIFFCRGVSIFVFKT